MNIYDSDGTLTGNRTITVTPFDLDFIRELTTPTVNTHFHMGNINVPPIGYLEGVFSMTHNETTGDISFMGSGDATPYGYSTDAGMIGHADSDGNTALLIVDNISTTPTLTSLTAFAGYPGSSFTQTPNTVVFSFPTNSTSLSIDDDKLAITNNKSIAFSGMYEVNGNSSEVDPVIPDGVRGMYYDSANIINKETITLPSNPVDGQEGIMIFGGTISHGTVIIAITIIAESSTHINVVMSTSLTTAVVGTEIRYKFRADKGASGTYYVTS